MRTAEGKVEIEIPQVRNTSEPFHSKLREFLRQNSECLKILNTKMYARGLSTRDIEDALKELTGSKVREVLWLEHERFSNQGFILF